jgi:hypothetical protein
VEFNANPMPQRQVVAAAKGDTMGVEQTVLLPAGTVLQWPTVAHRLAGQGYPVQLRMIDGLPAFPDEEPAADWSELRAGTGAGMVTLRRTPDGVSVVVWGTADPALRAAANALLWAVAEVGGGRVVTAAGAVTADLFARTADLPWGKS